MEALLKSYLPMSEPSFLLLSTLVDELHGYGIMQRVGDMTAGRVNLGAGTVYTILYKMENDGLVTVTRENDRRKIYRITPIGMEVLKAEAIRLIELSRIAGMSLNQLDTMQYALS